MTTTHRHSWLGREFGHPECMGCGSSRYQATLERGARQMAPSWAEWHALQADNERLRAPQPLDVERLARALIAVDDATPGIFNDLAISDPVAADLAALIVIEYAEAGSR